MAVARLMASILPFNEFTIIILCFILIITEIHKSSYSVATFNTSSNVVIPSLTFLSPDSKSDTIPSFFSLLLQFYLMTHFLKSKFAFVLETFSTSKTPHTSAKPFPLKLHEWTSFWTFHMINMHALYFSNVSFSLSVGWLSSNAHSLHNFLD